MGGDQGSRPCVLAAQEFIQQYPDSALILFGDESDIRSYLRSPISSRISIQHCSSSVAMHDLPVVALRSKQQSSMSEALQAVSGGRAHACVSGGNTGALLALSRHFIRTLDGVKRPAICRAMPTQLGTSYLLDLGANLHCSAENLYQFGVMGAALARVAGIERPRVALLNVGSEVSKGNELVREAAVRLDQAQDGYEYSGFIEGDELYSGKVDVIVCDGFTGNVALKVSEGVVKHLIESLQLFFRQSMGGRIARIIVGPLLKAWSRKKNPSLYNGAAFLGLRKTVVKSHGGADDLGLLKALEAAREQALAEIPKHISVQLDLK